VPLARAGTVDADGYIQPQFRTRQNDPNDADATDGFRVRRARLKLDTAQPLGDLTIEGHIEAEATPQFQLLDVYGALSGGLTGQGSWRLLAGQFKTPFSRQQMLSDADLQLVEKAQLMDLTPDRQIGVGGVLNVPFVPSIEISAGIFNGEGKDQPQNIDEKFMYIGRLAWRPIGTHAKLIESALGPDAVSLAVNAAYDVQEMGGVVQTTKRFGADAFGSWNGISGYAEIVNNQITSTGMGAQPNFGQRGLNVQLGYLLPIPGVLYRRFEVAARLEEIDRNDTVPIQRPGDPNQSSRVYEIGVSYYQLGHRLKLQVTAYHFQEIEDKDRNGMNATFPNDEILVQATYKLR
jgi:hypothetical protein